MKDLIKQWKTDGQWKVIDVEGAKRLTLLQSGDDGPLASLILKSSSQQMIVIASWGLGWEHVSVSLRHRCPSWDEMCAVKDVYWGPEEYVMQLHPPRSQWINNHPYCLHLWKPIDQAIPQPPGFMVGSPEINFAEEKP